MALAASALLERGKLGVDLVMLIEGASAQRLLGGSRVQLNLTRAAFLAGEEESGSQGLSEAIERHRVRPSDARLSEIGPIDLTVLLSRTTSARLMSSWRAIRAG